MKSIKIAKIGVLALLGGTLSYGQARLLVTEINSNQDSSGTEDYWELANVGDAAIDLSGWKWDDNSRDIGAAVTLPEGTQLAAGEALILTSMDADGFRAWWGLAATVQVITLDSPGLGKNDGVALFNPQGEEHFFFTYEADGFMLSDGSAAVGGHAGESAGSTATVAVVLDPAYGTESPRYKAAVVGEAGAFASTLSTAEIGSPGVIDAVVSDDSLVSVTTEGVDEGDEGTVSLAFIVARDSTATAFSVDYSITGGTAVAGEDYAALAAGTLQFEVGGAATQRIEITVNGDTQIEGDENILLTLDNLVNTTGVSALAGGVVSGEIRNDDFVVNPYAASDALIGAPLSSIVLGGAEIPAYDPASQRGFASSGDGIQVVDLSDPMAPVALPVIDMLALGFDSNDLSSISLYDGVLAVGIINSPKTEAGDLAFIEAATGALLGSVKVGPNPDAVTFTPDGSKVLVANEGELVGQVADDTAMGSVSIVDVSAGYANAVERKADFSAYDAQAAALTAAGVRIFEGGVPSLDFEPEYIAVTADSQTAMVTLQEANAVAKIDLASATVTAVVALGEKDYSGLYADFSDRDGPGGSRLINPTQGNPVYGLYMPDAIAAYSYNGETYYVIANEGDDRDDFVVPEESARLGDDGYTLDPTVFRNWAAVTLKEDNALGRLTVSNAPGLRGDTDGDGDIDRILAYGGRSFSILDADGAIVYDSGDMLELIVAGDYPGNADDGRSDNKGPEPEGAVVATFGGRTYAFIGLERTHMVVLFDVTDPQAVTYVGVLSNPGDENPEGMVVVSAADSPTGAPLVLVANEESNTLTVYQLEDGSVLPWEPQSSLGTWRHSVWFGHYTKVSADWLWHSAQGWLNVSASGTPNSVYLYSAALGSWTWSNRNLYPVSYDFERGDWVYYLHLDDGSAYAYYYTTGSWARVEG